MKKVTALALLLISLLALCSCGGSGTKLTKDNFTTYFKIDTGIKGIGEPARASNGAYFAYNTMKIVCNVNAISSNYNYSNVTVKIKLKGHYDYFDAAETYYAMKKVFIDPSVNFEETLTINVDISGKGESNTNEFTMPDGKLITPGASDCFTCDYEILSVTGTVEKA